jgi:Transposase DDE domain group 1
MTWCFTVSWRVVGAVVAHLMGAGAGEPTVTREGCSSSEERSGSGRLRGNHTCNCQTGALFAMKDTSWDHALEVTADGNGLVGHGGGILLRKLADQCGLTAELDAALAQKGTSPQFSRGVALASTAIAIAMGATAMADIEVLDQLAPVLGAAPSDSTVRRTLNLADDRTLMRISQARARIRAHVWKQVQDAGGFPWLEIAGKTLAGWLFLDMDGTLITAYSDKEGAAPTWKKGFGLLTELRELSLQFRGRAVVGAVTVPGHDGIR